MLAASSGIDVKTLQGIAGYSDIKMTLDRYAYHKEEKVVEARERISGVFSSPVTARMRKKARQHKGKTGMVGSGL